MTYDETEMGKAEDPGYKGVFIPGVLDKGTDGRAKSGAERSGENKR